MLARRIVSFYGGKSGAVRSLNWPCREPFEEILKATARKLENRCVESRNGFLFFTFVLLQIAALQGRRGGVLS